MGSSDLADVSLGLPNRVWFNSNAALRKLDGPQGRRQNNSPGAKRGVYSESPARLQTMVEDKIRNGIVDVDGKPLEKLVEIPKDEEEVRRIGV